MFKKNILTGCFEPLTPEIDCVVEERMDILSQIKDCKARLREAEAILETAEIKIIKQNQELERLKRKRLDDRKNGKTQNIRISDCKTVKVKQ